jgi:hypothetical protein
MDIWSVGKIVNDINVHPDKNPIDKGFAASSRYILTGGDKELFSEYCSHYTNDKDLIWKLMTKIISFDVEDIASADPSYGNQRITGYSQDVQSRLYNSEHFEKIEKWFIQTVRQDCTPYIWDKQGTKICV